MYELIKITDSCYYVDCPAKVGVVVIGEGRVCLIDGGSDKDAAKKILRAVEGQGWRIEAIYNTHSHADHIGGNAFLQDKTGCRVFAPGIEAAFTAYPILESSLLYGGYPPKDLRHKFLFAKECRVETLTEEALPEGFEIISLPGHSFDAVGYRTPDSVVYLGDCLSGRATLEKYRIGYLYDLTAYLETLERVKEMQAVAFVPAHAEVTADIAPLAQYNIDVVGEVIQRILDICAAPVTFEELLRRLFEGYGLTMTFEQYVLVGGAVRAYLSHLRDAGRLNVSFEGSLMLWSAV